MSLKSRITRVLLCTFLLAAAAHYAIQRYVMLPGFLRLEEQEARKDLDRCRFAIDRELSYLDITCHEWATSDQIAPYVAAGDRRALGSLATPEAILTSRLNLIYVFDRQGNLIRGDVRSLQSYGSLFLPEFNPRRFSPEHPLLRHASAAGGRKGLVSTGLGPMLVASRPIVHAAPTGAICGTLIIGRFLDHRAIQALAAQTRVNLRTWVVDDPGIDEEGLAALSQLSRRGDLASKAMDDQMLRAYATYPGLDGAPVLLMRIDVPRTLLGSVNSATRFASLTLLAAGMLLLLILGWILHTSVVVPLMRLGRNVASIAAGQDLSRRLRLRRRDEIGLLALEFDHLMSRLERIHDRLRHAAMHDELTGLPNRAAILERLRVCMERTRRQPDFTFALLFLDMDKFKHVNDTLGHDAGDELLRQLAGRLRECVRATDAVARSTEAPPRTHELTESAQGHPSCEPGLYGPEAAIRCAPDLNPDADEDAPAVARLGGDEFLILLEEIEDEEDARQVAARISQAIAEPFVIQQRRVTIGGSIGIVVNTPFTTADQMLRAADAAMYHAKLQARQPAANLPTEPHSV